MPQPCLFNASDGFPCFGDEATPVCGQFEPYPSSARDSEICAYCLHEREEHEGQETKRRPK
jgi:hypothetical protein